MDELDRRGAAVFVHRSELPCDTVPGIAPYVADFVLDTVRAAVNLARRGTLCQRSPAVDGKRALVLSTASARLTRITH